MTDRPTVERSRFESISDRLVREVACGSTFVAAAAEAGVSPNTARNWLSAGRRDPEGRYGSFARAVDDARAVSEVNGPDIGPVALEVDLLISTRSLDERGRVVAAQARALAGSIDRLASTRGSASGSALAAASRRLDDLLDALRLQTKDAIAELQDRRAQRLAGLGL